MHKARLTIALSTAALLGWHDSAVAAEVACDILFQRLLKQSGAPVIKIDPKAETVRIEAGGDFCSEPIAVWAAREAPPIPPPPKAPRRPPVRRPPVEASAPPPPAPPEASPRPRQGTQPAPAVEKPVQKPPTKPAATPGAPPASAEGCSVHLDALWQPGHHEIIGIHYWLSQVFTIDLDGDGITDNVGFRFVAPGARDLVIRYFAAPGLLAARSVPSLRLADESAIYHLCFGQQEFGPEPSPQVKPKAVQLIKPFEPPDLAKEMRAKQEAEAAAASGAAKGKGLVGAVRRHWKVIVGVALSLLLAGGAIAYLTRERWMRRAGAMSESDGENADDDIELGPGDEEDDGEDAEK